jgi:hypothetical protein
MNLDAISRPAMSNVEIRPDRLRDWVNAGLNLTHKDYERLVTKLSELGSKPRVILLYNPSAYEIYRDISLGRNPEYDELAAFQLKAQQHFAEKHRWIFFDLTVPLRNELKESKQWIYGRYDSTHWSPTGTATVAKLLKAELLGIIGTGPFLQQTPSFSSLRRQG